MHTNRRININIGILGHVDSGKTSLAKCMSSVQSTAAFDKNPQSQQRGITLDLGFSCFSMMCDGHELQFTLVDCPGHASLIRTIIGGVQIIDVVLLVIDITKGIQAQTAECLVIRQITCKKMIVVLNKVDLLEEVTRQKQIGKMKHKLAKILSASGHGEDIPMIATSAINADSSVNNIPHLIEKIATFSSIPQRSDEGPFHFAVDHCFAIKGQGTVMTGTVLQGSVSINDTIEIPKLSMTRKVKSMQMFKQPVQHAVQGDRLGICVTQFDPKLMERGIVCSPELGSFVRCIIADFNAIEYFKAPIISKSKYHITIGYETVLANLTLFAPSDNPTAKRIFDVGKEYEFIERFDNVDKSTQKWPSFVLLEFEFPVYAVRESLIIASKLDMDIHKNACRLAFWGKLAASSKADELKRTKIFKYKEKTGCIDRVIDKYHVIVKGLFKKETRLDAFLQFKVQLQNADVDGVIESSFGQSGKVKVYVANGISCEQEEGVQKLKNSTVVLKFKKYLLGNVVDLKQ